MAMEVSMGRFYRNGLWGGILILTFLPGITEANSIYGRAPGFTIPAGDIAYMGSFFSPLRVHANGSNTQFLIPKDIRLFSQPFFVAPKTQAIHETDDAVQSKATEMGLPLAPVTFNETYQSALLMHVLNPKKYLYNPQIARFCGNKPYILIAIVDFYAEFSCSINIREKETGEPIAYFGRRSIIERDMSFFRNKGRQSAVALEFFLISSKDGSTLWQANTITTGGSLFDGYEGIAKGLVDGAFRDLMKR
jgi:hypothetical protein